MADLDTNQYQDKYILNNEEKDLYLKSVITLFTAKIQPCSPKTLIFVSGQTGCGKSEVIKMLRKQNQNQVIYSFDEIRAMHPKFEQANQELKGDTHAALFPDTDWACNELLDYCIKHNLSVVKEASMRRTDDIKETAELFRKAGYFIDVRLMAVPSIDSYVGTLERYVDQLSHKEPARWITRKAHDDTFSQIPKTLTYLVHNQTFDRITIYKRGNPANGQPPQEIYSTDNTRQFSSPVDALNYGRNNFTESQTPAFWKKVGWLITFIQTHSPDRNSELKEYIIGLHQKNAGNEIIL